MDFDSTDIWGRPLTWQEFHKKDRGGALMMMIGSRWLGRRESRWLKWCWGGTRYWYLRGLFLWPSYLSLLPWLQLNNHNNVLLFCCKETRQVCTQSCTGSSLFGLHDLFSLSLSLFVHGFCGPKWTSNDHPVAHHPLDAIYGSIYDELSTGLISGFTMVTHSVRSRSYMYV